MNGTCVPDGGWGKRGVALSAGIHACLIAVILCASGQYMLHPPELTTIFLDNEKTVPLMGKPGGDGRKAGSEGMDKQAAKGTAKTVFKKSVKPLVPTRVATAAPERSEVGAPTQPPESAPAASAYEGIKGNGEGHGGGGGRGIGAYGSGSGFGGTGTDGMGGGRGAGLAAAKRPDIEGYLKHNYQYIRELIVKHLIYPSMAKKMGWEGKVVVSFVITESGRADSLKVVNSSGYSVLDNNVLETIKEVEPFPKPPAAAKINIPITYNLDRT